MIRSCHRTPASPTVVRAAGVIDISTAPRSRARLDAAMIRRRPVVLDLEQVFVHRRPPASGCSSARIGARRS